MILQGKSMIYDVAVVGGGIAGAASVIALAQAGVSTFWLRPPFTDEQHRVGESLAPAANTLLKELGLWSLLQNTAHRSSNTTFSAWGADFLVERNAAVHLEGAGHVIDRYRFEQDLFATADEASSAILEDILASYLVDDGLWLLTGESGSQSHCRFLIDATGRAQVVGRGLGCGETEDNLVAAYSFLSQKQHSDVEPTKATLIETVRNGWWYAALLPSGCLALNYYSDPDLLPKGLTKNCDIWRDLISQTQQIRHWIDDAEFLVDAPPKLASAATRWIVPSADVYKGLPWAAVGDAAASFDPLSAHGMTTALWAASRMPAVVKNMLVGDSDVLKGYAQAVAKGVDAFNQQRLDMYSREQRFMDETFWARRVMQK